MSFTITKTLSQVTLASIVLVASTTTVSAALLTSTTMTQLTKPASDPGISIKVNPLPITPTTGTFAETWNGTNADTAWLGGQWEATGPNNRPPTQTGNTAYDFTTLSAGSLPVSTFITMGDVDRGTGVGETFSFTAFSALNTPILIPWLDLLGTTAAIDSQLPRYQWNPLTGEYFFDGSNVPGNPSVAFRMLTTVSIAVLEVDKARTSYSFNIAAPEAAVVPVPSAFWLFGSGLLGLAGFIKNKKHNLK